MLFLQQKKMCSWSNISILPCVYESSKEKHASTGGGGGEEKEKTVKA